MSRECLRKYYKVLTTQKKLFKIKEVELFKDKMKNNRRYLLLIPSLLLIAFSLSRLFPDLMLRLNPPAYAPAGYTVTQDRHEGAVDGGIIYTTTMVKGDKKINVVEQLDTPFDISTCNGPKKTILNLQICYYQREGSDPQFKNIIYGREGQYYAIRTNDDLSDADLAKIISHL